MIMVHSFMPNPQTNIHVSRQKYMTTNDLVGLGKLLTETREKYIGGIHIITSLKKLN